MVESHTNLTVQELLTTDVYAIPLYQRNFAWSYDEIAQLFNDIADAYLENRDNYYIGTLIANRKDDQLDIIDGQQRTTALTLIALAMKNQGISLGFDWSHVTLTFPARKKSQDNLERLFANKDSDISEVMENDITLGYRRAQEALKIVFTERELTGDQDFISYFFNNVIIFRSILPSDLDLNLYFERFNSRGEQLKTHEIIKAQLMAKFGDNQVLAGRFAKIWDACADFEKPVILAFQKKSKSTDNDSERELIFRVENSGYYQFSHRFEINLDSNLNPVHHLIENKQSLLDAIEGENKENEQPDTFYSDEIVNYSTVVNFETFLYYVYYLTFGNLSPEDIQLDDKKLLDTFSSLTDTSGTVEDVIKFVRNLLQLKFIFDNLIVRMSHETVGEGRRRENEWFLQKVYRTDVNQKKGGHRYVQYRFDKNAFEKFNKEILMLQSMFAVTFTANRDSRWLYEILQYLFEHVYDLSDESFGVEFKGLLEKMARRYARDRIYTVDNQIKSYQEGIPVYAFNYIDYVFWKYRDKLKKRFNTVSYDSFKFSYRRSIEHWFPQNPIGEDSVERLDNDDLHAIGNLCIITDSQNSKFGNLVPNAKLSSWQNIFPNQSLKLQMMAEITTRENKWDKEEIQTLTKLVKGYLTKELDIFEGSAK